MSLYDTGFSIVLEEAGTALAIPAGNPQPAAMRFIGAAVAYNPNSIVLPDGTRIAGVDITLGPPVAGSEDLPLQLGTADPGSGPEYAFWDHVHPHGNQAGDALHAPASNLAAGFQSVAHYNLLANATASITEGTILIRGGSAELKGKWLETDSGTGARATVGDVRCAKDGVAAAFRNAADNGDIQLASCDTDVISHGDDSACAGHAYRVAAGGEHNFFIDGAGVVRIKYDAGKETIQFLNAGTAQIVGSTDGALKLITGSTAWVSVGLGGVGFYGNAPVAQITITQDYLDTATNVDAYAPDDESVAYDGINNLQPGEVYATVADLNATRAALENLRAAVENRMKVLNAMIDQFQLRGDFL